MMDTPFMFLQDNLHQAAEHYHSVICNSLFDYKNWKENVRLLSPIVAKLKKQAVTKFNFCKEKIQELNHSQVSALEKRAAFYAELESDKSKLSDLETEQIRIISEISLLTQEIQGNKQEIQKLQNTVAEIKKENDYWNTVFWATCWIPFANIGTGIKKDVEDGKYYAKVNVLVKDIRNKEERIKNLNDAQQIILRKQKENKESSSSLGNQITTVEGEIAAVTTSINELREELNLWHIVLTICSEIDVRLENSNGKLEVVKEGFDNLMKLEQLLSLPKTDKYIKGCKSRGDTLSIGECLNRNEYLISKNRRFVAIMQSDNNFVVYNSEKPLWSSHTNGLRGNAYLELDSEGLVRLKGINYNWNTKRKGAISLIMQDDGNLITYDKNHKPLWSTDTYIYANELSICFG